MLKQKVEDFTVLYDEAMYNPSYDLKKGFMVSL